MPRNKVKFGLKNVHYALLTTEEAGKISYGTPAPWPGAVDLSMEAQGDTSSFYADDVAYYVTSANTGYQGTFESALVPDDFSQNVLKEELHSQDKVLVERSTAESVPFALLFEFTGDQRGIKHVLYNCTAARPNLAGSTATNTKEPKTSPLTITAAPLADGLVKAKTTADTPEAVVDGWYQKVWMPSQEGA